MPLRREHRWVSPSRKVKAQCSFVIPVEPDEAMLRSAWHRSGLSLTFDACMRDPVLARIIRMMARQGAKHREAIGGEHEIFN